MLNNKILCIGNNTIETDYLARKTALKLDVPFNGIINIISTEPTVGLYHTSIEDLSIEGINKIINKFDSIKIFEQSHSQDQEAYFQRMTLKNQIEFRDVDYPCPDESLLFVGCSHTAGTGHTTVDTVYTSLFSSLLGEKSVICGNPGKGNWLFEKILNQYRLNNTCVVIQFTDIFRTRYYNAMGTLVEKQGKDYSKNEVEFFSEEKLTKDFLELVNAIVIRLRDANAKFVFFQLSHYHANTCLIDYELSKYKEFCWIPDVLQDFADDGIHFGVNSHRLIADKLFATWNKLYAQN
jgi:hypothetical protein